MEGSIVYSSPFVPAEWIAAHGLAPHRLLSDAVDTDVAQGVCPFASDFATCSAHVADVRGIIVASTCDQMRRSAERIAAGGVVPVFLLNVPATWQRESSRQLYRSEMLRLGRFLVACGGTAPRQEQLAATMREFDARRRALLAARLELTAREYAEAICHVNRDIDAASRTAEEVPTSMQHLGAAPGLTPTSSASAAPELLSRKASAVVRVALVGGPLRQADFWIYDLVEQLGASVVLDATEAAERGMPAPFDEDRLQVDPLGELTRAYFDTIPDAFRRPDALLHEYLRRQLTSRSAQGVILVRYAWCDHWHALRGRLRETLSLPVTEVDLGGSDEQLQRTRTRIEALVSILR